MKNKNLTDYVKIQKNVKDMKVADIRGFYNADIINYMLELLSDGVSVNDIRHQILRLEDKQDQVLLLSVLVSQLEG